MSVECILRLHSDLVHQWDEGAEAHPHEGYLEIIGRHHLFNFRLWRLEDRARDLSASFEELAKLKRSIDQLNQLRNDAIEQIDDWLAEELKSRQVSLSSQAVLNTETTGSVIDRLSILALRIYHLELQITRQDVDQQHLTEVARRLTLCCEQRSDLAESLERLLQNLTDGLAIHKTYRHLKMYNDPRFNAYLNEARKDGGPES